jgi:nitroreductase
MGQTVDQIMEVIKKRRSIRVYKNRPLSREIIDSLLQAAEYAPNARNLQQLEYKVITNQGLIKGISDKIVAGLKEENPQVQLSARAQSNLFYEAPLLIIITGPKENIWTYSDAALAAENIMLYAASVDLGTCFIGNARHIDKDEELLRELHVPNDSKIAAAVVCGYPDEEPAEKDRKMKAEFFQ